MTIPIPRRMRAILPGILFLLLLFLGACSRSQPADEPATVTPPAPIEAPATPTIPPDIATPRPESTAAVEKLDPVVDTPAPSPSLPVPAADLETHAIGVYLYPDDEITGPAVDMMAEAGALWARSWLDWDEVEPVLTDPPTYDWSAIDARLLAARRAGLEPLFLLGGNARWASDSFCGPIYPQQQAAFQRFLRDAVARYSVEPYGVRLWEIYNEPDSESGPQGSCFGGRGAAYADTLRLAYPAIKDADPEAVVLFGGISYDFFTNEGGYFDPAFLDDALAAGAGPYFDILAFHYYPAFARRWQGFGHGVAGKAAYLRGELARYGLDKPLAVTELGRPTRGPDDDPTTYDERSTARFVAPALTLARASGLAPIIWFTAVDKPNEPYDYGLLNAELQPEPSYRAYAAVLPALQGGDYLGELPVQGSGQAHRFQHADRQAIVAWADEGEAFLDIETAAIELVDRQGESTTIQDGSPADLDPQTGTIRLLLTIDPIVIWFP